MTRHSTRVVEAGVAYFAIVFAAGFALGTVRVLLLAPRFGELLPVLLELPLMLGISWLACGWVLVRFQIPQRIPLRLSVGVVAFGLLMLSELMLSTAVFGRSLSDHIHELATPHGLVGLGGQVLFGLMPLVSARKVAF